MVSHLIGGIAHKDVGLLECLCDALQADGDPVSAHDGEYDADGIAAEFVPAVFRNVFNACIISLGPGYHCLSHSHHVLLMEGDVLLFAHLKDGLRYDLYQIVSFLYDRTSDAS